MRQWLKFSIRMRNTPQSPQLAADADDFIWMPDEGFRNAFAQHATADQVALAAARLGIAGISNSCQKQKRVVGLNGQPLHLTGRILVGVTFTPLMRGEKEK